MLFGGEDDKMADEKGEIFFVICRCSFGVKCQTVNVKGGEERWGQRRSLVITLPPVSLSSPLLCLFFCILKLAVCLFSCCFLKLFASFDCHQHLAQGQDLPLHMHATAHACEHNPPTTSRFSPASTHTQPSCLCMLVSKR